MNIIAMDPSFSAFGVAIIDIDAHRLVHGAVFTSPPAGDINIEDRPFQRVRELLSPILRLIDDYKCVGMVAEIPYYGREYNSAMMAGTVQGLLASIPVFIEVTRQGLYFPAVGVLPVHIKQIAEGLPYGLVADVATKLGVHPNPNKHKIIARVAMDYSNIYEVGNNTAYKVEAIADACGAWFAGQNRFMFFLGLESFPNYRKQIRQKKQKVTGKQEKLL